MGRDRDRWSEDECLTNIGRIELLLSTKDA